MSTTPTDTKTKTKLAQAKPRIIFEGELFIQGWFSTWRSRHCTLCINRTLCAYNNADQAHSSTQPKHILDLSTVITIKQTQNPNQTPSTPTSKNSKLKKKKTKFIFEITTASHDILLSSINEDTISQWIRHLKTYVFGTIIHTGYMTKQGFIKKSWKKRYFTLSSNWKELRYFENNVMNKNAYKGNIDLYSVKVLRSYVSFAKHEFILELLTLKRTYIFINEFHDEHITWMNKLEEVLNGINSCSYCDKNKWDTFGKYDNQIYYKMSSLHEGILHTFIPMDKTDINKGGKWEKNYYAIDGRTMRLFYTRRIIKMESFQNALIEKNFYEKYISECMDGYYLLFGESIEMIDGNIYNDSDDDEPSMILMGTSTIGEIGECDAEDVMGPGFVITPGGDGMGGDGMGDSDIEDGKDDIKEEEVWDSYDKFKYKFTIGEYVFGVGSSKEAKLWVYGLKNAVDFNMREVYNYCDEKHYLCKMHLSLLICRFYYGKRRDKSENINGKVMNGFDSDDMEIPFGAYKYLVKCIGMKCWDNENLVSF
eukprot:402046_1